MSLLRDNKNMVADLKARQRVKVLPLISERWKDLESVVGGSGDSGCWCMWWRLSDEEFEEQRGQANKMALRRIVDSGKMPGVIAYLSNRPAGWCSIGPRQEFPRLDRSFLFGRIDDEPVWSIVCYYVNRAFRGRGLMEHLTRGAVELAVSKGVCTVEAYPVDLPEGSSSAGAYTGIAAILRRVGFTDVVRRLPDRPIMRLHVAAPARLAKA